MLRGVTTGDVTSTWEPKRTGTKATPKDGDTSKHTEANWIYRE